MSGSKATTISHRALDELVKFKTALVTDIGQFKTDVLKAVQEVIKAVSEVQTKHNDLAAHIVAVEGMAKNTAAFAASEIGKLGGMSQRHFNELDKSVSAVDLNVLALAELSKEVIGQLTQADALIARLHSTIKTLLSNRWGILDDTGQARQLNDNDLLAFKNALELADSDVQEIKINADKWYGDLVASAFKTVQARIAVEDEARREKEASAAQEAQAAAEKAATDAAETKAVETEVQKANMNDLSVAAATSGGSGSMYPEGAEIFGG